MQSSAAVDRVLGAGLLGGARQRLLRPCQTQLYRARFRRGVARPQATGESDPDWEEEMSIFKKRTLKPSQLETLRKFEGEMGLEVGRVGSVQGGGLPLAGEGHA
jgi:hypothetical protein